MKGILFFALLACAFCVEFPVEADDFKLELPEINLEFTEQQKLVYNIVLKGQELVFKNIKPGISTKEINKLAHDYILSRGATPSFLNL